MRSTDIERLKKLDIAIEAGFLANSRRQLVPFPRWVKHQAALSLQNMIGDVQTVVTLRLQDIAKTDRDTYPPLFVQRMVETATEHNISPQFPTTSHSSPDQSRKN